MSKYNAFKAGINRMLEDGYKRIQATHLFTYSFENIELIEESLEKWEKLGVLKILKPYRECSPNEYCIEMLKFIEQKSPIKGYMNWENE